MAEFIGGLFCSVCLFRLYDGIYNLYGRPPDPLQLLVDLTPVLLDVVATRTLPGWVNAYAIVPVLIELFRSRLLQNTSTLVSVVPSYGK